MIQLYSYFRSSAAYRVRIALNYKQLPHEIISVHLVNHGGEHTHPEYLAKNPQGLVPLLIDGEMTLSQSVAVLTYLEEKYPQHSLVPTDFASRALMHQLVQTIACDIHPLDNLRVLKYLKSTLAVTDEQKSEWYAHWIHEGFAAIEKTLSKCSNGQYALGEHLSWADCCLIPQVYNAKRFAVAMDNYPTIESVYAHCLTLDCVQRAAPESQPDCDI